MARVHLLDSTGKADGTTAAVALDLRRSVLLEVFFLKGSTRVTVSSRRARARGMVNDQWSMAKEARGKGARGERSKEVRVGKRGWRDSNTGRDPGRDNRG